LKTISNERFRGSYEISCVHISGAEISELFDGLIDAPSDEVKITIGNVFDESYQVSKDLNDLASYEKSLRLPIEICFQNIDVLLDTYYAKVRFNKESKITAEEIKKRLEEKRAILAFLQADWAFPIAILLIAAVSVGIGVYIDKTLFFWVYGFLVALLLILTPQKGTKLKFKKQARAQWLADLFDKKGLGWAIIIGGLPLIVAWILRQ
jgi:hypothetical protein